MLFKHKVCFVIKILSFKNFKNIYFYLCVYIFVSVRGSVYCVVARLEEGVRSPGTIATDGFEPLCGC